MNRFEGASVLSFKTPTRKKSPIKLDPINLVLSPKQSIQQLDFEFDIASDEGTKM
jgi:hypothetical protein